MITEWEINKVNEYLKWLQESGLAENELGAPIKVTVDWGKRIVLVKGPTRGKQLEIGDILKAD